MFYRLFLKDQSEKHDNEAPEEVKNKVKTVPRGAKECLVFPCVNGNLEETAVRHLAQKADRRAQLRGIWTDPELTGCEEIFISLLVRLGFSGFTDNFLGHVSWDFFVFEKFHSVGSLALGHGSDLSGVAKHFRQRHFGIDNFEVAAISHFRILPRLALRSPMTSPKDDSGVMTSTFMIGSSIIG
jgi:hypothetical protein